MNNDLPSSECSLQREKILVVNRESTPPPSPRLRRRGPGRPSKQEKEKFSNKKPYTSAQRRRELHNESALNSRTRLNVALEEQWNVIPEAEKSQTGMENSGGKVCRADRVICGTNYMKKLQRLADLKGGDIPGKSSFES